MTPSSLKIIERSPADHASKRFFHVEPLPEDTPLNGDRVSRFLVAFAAILRHSNYRFLLDLYSRTSSKCGRCAVSCQVYQASGDPRDVPCYRTNMLLDIYRRYFTPYGSIVNRLSRRELLSEEVIDTMAELYYRCTACRRCSLECPMGVDHGLITHLGRYILSEAGIAPKGLVVSVREQLEGKTSNTSAIPLPALLDNIEFLEEELYDTTGAQIQFPVDRIGADYILFPAVSDYLMEADTLMGIAAMLHQAGISWTVGSRYFDAINYGLFYNDWVLERIINKLVAEARRLDAKNILVCECGHASRSAKHFVPNFLQENALPVVSILELAASLILDGRVALDPNVVTERVTYHDPCNLSRSGWIVQQPRQILHSFVGDFVEMTPHGRENYCCGGGGGLVSLDETHEFRMRVSGKKKAEQIEATGAQIVATPCANCKKQLRELMEYYDLPVQIVGVHDLILRAIKLT